MKKILICGGAGFIGVNLAARGISDGHEVTVLDNLSRSGTNLNLDWLKTKGKFEFKQIDIRDFTSLLDFFRTKKFDVVFHQAAQVAVTTSVKDPRHDFELNLLGTFNLLEAIRATSQNPVFIYASTNKVYGLLSSHKVVEKNGRYSYENFPNGVSENVLLDFHSPYGCSKGGADQYVMDYRRIYGLRTIVFRQSCIYGPRQMGLEDQGWLAWFAICGVNNKGINIYGDGKQVRDVLYIDDLVNLYFKAVDIEPKLKSFVFNVGGGPTCAVSLVDVIKYLEEKLGRQIELNYSKWRPGDQKVYISDISSVSSAFDWKPATLPKEGTFKLLSWISENKAIFNNLVLN